MFIFSAVSSVQLQTKTLPLPIYYSHTLNLDVTLDPFKKYPQFCASSAGNISVSCGQTLQISSFLL